MKEESKKILARLEALCAKAEYCRSDMFRKALKATEDAAEAGEITDSLVKNRFVDDARYAAAFAREKASLSGWGPIKIRFALRAKRISEPAITEALDGIEDGKACAKLEKLLETKAASLKGDPAIKLKLIRFALSRGYEYDAVESALAHLTSL